MKGLCLVENDCISSIEICAHWNEIESSQICLIEGSVPIFYKHFEENREWCHVASQNGMILYDLSLKEWNQLSEVSQVVHLAHIYCSAQSQGWLYVFKMCAKVCKGAKWRTPNEGFVPRIPLREMSFNSVWWRGGLQDSAYPSRSVVLVFFFYFFSPPSVCASRTLLLFVTGVPRTPVHLCPVLSSLSLYGTQGLPVSCKEAESSLQHSYQLKQCYSTINWSSALLSRSYQWCLQKEPAFSDWAQWHRHTQFDHSSSFPSCFGHKCVWNEWRSE